MITTGHTCLGSSETEVEPTYLGRLPLDSVKPIPSTLLKIMRRPPERGPVSAMSKINKGKRAGQSDSQPLHAALGAKSTFSIIFMQKERA